MVTLGTKEWAGSRRRARITKIGKARDGVLSDWMFEGPGLGFDLNELRVIQEMAETFGQEVALGFCAALAGDVEAVKLFVVDTYLKDA